MRALHTIRIGLAALSLCAASTAGAQERPPIKAWGSAGFGLTSSGGSMGRLAVAGSFSHAMIVVRQLSVNSGYDQEDASKTDKALLLGFRTLGTSFLSVAVGPARVRHKYAMCPHPSTCAATPGSGVTYQMAADAALPWTSIGLMYFHTNSKGPCRRAVSFCPSESGSSDNEDVSDAARS